MPPVLPPPLPCTHGAPLCPRRREKPMAYFLRLKSFAVRRDSHIKSLRLHKAVPKELTTDEVNDRHAQGSICGARSPPHVPLHNLIHRKTKQFHSQQTKSEQNLWNVRHSYTHTHTNKQTHKYKYKYKHTHTNTHARTHTQTHTHTHIHTQTHKYTHTHTCLERKGERHGKAYEAVTP